MRARAGRSESIADGSRMKGSCARLAELEIGSRLEAAIVPVVDQRAVDKDALGDRVHAERIGAPHHDIGHLARLETASPVGDTQCTGRIRCNPRDSPRTRYFDAGTQSRA